MKVTKEQSERAYLALLAGIDRVEEVLMQYHHAIQFINNKELMQEFAEYLFNRMEDK